MNNAATLKKQKEELEVEKELMEEAMRQKEEALSNTLARLSAAEAASRRVSSIHHRLLVTG
jgi:CBS-domain-containing membrane protein